MPFGLLEVVAGLLTIIVGTSQETRDFIADCIERWWQTHQERLASIRRLVVDLDNGPENFGMVLLPSVRAFFYC